MGQHSLCSSSKILIRFTANRVLMLQCENTFLCVQTLELQNWLAPCTKFNKHTLKFCYCDLKDLFSSCKVVFILTVIIVYYIYTF